MLERLVEEAMFDVVGSRLQVIIVNLSRRQLLGLDLLQELPEQGMKTVGRLAAGYFLDEQPLTLALLQQLRGLLSKIAAASAAVNSGRMATLTRKCISLSSTAFRISAAIY